MSFIRNSADSELRDGYRNVAILWCRLCDLFDHVTSLARCIPIVGPISIPCFDDGAAVPFRLLILAIQWS